MPETIRPRFEHFDQQIAEAMIKANAADRGLPAFLGVRFVAFEPGRLVAEADVQPHFITPFGIIHGGIMAALVDHVLGCVLYPLMQRGQWAATTEFKLNYLAPVKSGTIVAESTVVSLTRATAVVRVDVTNESRLAAMAQGTLLIRDPKGAS